MCAAETIYVDHQIIVEGRNHELLRSICQADNRRIVISQYNLLEIAQGSDQRRAHRYMELIDDLNPMWARDRLDVQDQEVKSFLWKSYFNVPPQQVTPFSTSMSVVLAYHLRSSVPIIGTAKDWHKTFADKVNIDEPKQDTVRALTVLQGVSKQKWKATDHLAFHGWVFKHTPLCDPENHLMNRSQRLQMADYCVANKVEFLNACPSLTVEDTLTGVRTSDPRRVAEPQDAIDLQHSALALAYCNVFITADRYLYHCAEQTKARLRNLQLASVFKNLSALQAEQHM